MEVPINFRKLRFLGYVNPQSVLQGRHNDDPLLNTVSNIFKYDNLYISISHNARIDRYLVYYIIHACVLMQYKYPYIFQTLFKNTGDIPFEDLAAAQQAGTTVQWVNTNRYIFVSLDFPTPPPTTFSKLGPFEVQYDGPLANLPVCSNVHVIKLNRDILAHGGATGRVPIYRTFKNGIYPFQQYMLDGFLNTFAHESIHDMIGSYSNLCPQFKFIRYDRQTQHLIGNYYTFEETLVNNTTNMFFKSGSRNGLSPDYLAFYKKEFDLSITKLKDSSFYNGLKNRIIADSHLGNNIPDELLFAIDLDSKNIGINGVIGMQVLQQKIQQTDKVVQFSQDVVVAQIRQQQLQQQQQQMLIQQQQQQPRVN